MTTTKTRFAWGLVPVLVLVTAAACGGASGAVKPRPLDYHFKEQHLAKVPADQKTEMRAAQAEYNRVMQENRKAESDWANSKRAVEAAEAEASRAHGQKESADSQRSAAEDSKDSKNWQQVNMATRDQRVAEVAQRAADQKVEMVKAHRGWLEKYVKYTREYVFAAEAKYELAKANVARAHNIAPPDFAYQAYVDQYGERRKKADKLKGPADSEKKEWLDEKKEYAARRRDDNEARGIHTAATSDKPGKSDDKK